MNFKSFLLAVIICCNIVNADLVGYNRYVNRYEGHIMARRRNFKNMSERNNLIQQYRLFFDITLEN